MTSSSSSTTEFSSRKKSSSASEELPERRWDRLDEILTRMETSLFDATPQDVCEIGMLYQKTLTDLGKARARGDAILAGNLNGLVGRAYSQIYRKPSLRVMDIVTFYWSEFPRLVRARIHYFLVAFLIYAFSFSIGFLCISHDSKLLDLVIPAKLKSCIEASLYQYGSSTDQMTFTTATLTHNIQVAILAFLGGLPFGLGTIYMLIINGIMLGGIVSMAQGAGRLASTGSLIFPHLSIELITIFLCSGAGFIIAFALIKPGPHRRRDWLAQEGLDAVKIIAGAFPMFILAAFVEAQITPLVSIDVIWRYLIGALLIELILIYLAMGGISLERLKELFRRRSESVDAASPLLR
ncbi:MAG: stage II sporulation protein M [Candidatus Riflebacteria bacterium]|nr:stage II sporulation protein M [Candidatus Riflebacteria bacterium]